jgi:hypothetical protein
VTCKLRGGAEESESSLMLLTVQMPTSNSN